MKKLSPAALLTRATNSMRGLTTSWGRMTLRNNESRHPIVSSEELTEGVIDLLTTVGLDENFSPKHKAASQYIEDFEERHGGTLDRQDLLLSCVEQIGDANTPRKRRAVAEAYLLCKSEYTLYAIDAFEKYASGGLFIDPDGEGVGWGFVYASLGSLYERNHEYNKAEQCYKKLMKYDTESHFPYIYLSEVYRKMNRLDEGIAILKKAKNHPHYKTNRDDLFKEVIDNYLSELIDKKKRGYVFRPRKHKDFLSVK